jgi:HTH-type transcriptional regulator/antitoxin HigA
MISQLSTKVDDFYVTPNSTNTLKSLIDSYVEFESELAKLPKQDKPLSDSSILNFYREVHANRKGDRLYRKRDDASDGLTVLWLSKVKELAALYTYLNQVKPFVGISKNELKQIAQSSSDINNLFGLESFFAEMGIIFIVESSLAGSKLDGAVFMLESGQAVVALSLRYKRLDYFWFTLMHELAHLSLHPESLQAGIIENLDDESESIIELEADKLALNSFVPRNIWRNCPPKYSFSEDTVIKFAQEQGIHPAIVAGRLRKELNRYDSLSNLVNEIDVREFF